MSISLLDTSGGVGAPDQDCLKAAAAIKREKAMKAIKHDEGKEGHKGYGKGMDEGFAEQWRIGLGA